MYFFAVPLLTSALTVTSSSNLTISAEVGSGSSGGGGGGGGGGTYSPTTVVFNGTAYPLSKVYILKDGVLAASTIADPSAAFSVSLSSLTTGSYTFSVYGEDSEGRKSAYFSFPVYVTAGTTVTVGNIFIAPTIAIDKTQVKQGDPLMIFGQSVPNADVSIVVNSLVPHVNKVKTTSNGSYLYKFDTAVLEYGDHTTKSETLTPTDISMFSKVLNFSVGTKSLPVDTVLCGTIPADLNCDKKVNLVDFSIMAYWYKKANVPKKVDLNKDGKVDLSDFSILAYFWTG